MKSCLTFFPEESYLYYTGYYTNLPSSQEEDIIFQDYSLFNIFLKRYSQYKLPMPPFEKHAEMLEIHKELFPTCLWVASLNGSHRVHGLNVLVCCSFILKLHFRSLSCIWNAACYIPLFILSKNLILFAESKYWTQVDMPAEDFRSECTDVFILL